MTRTAPDTAIRPQPRPGLDGGQLLDHGLLARREGYVVVIHDRDGDRYWSGHLVDGGDTRVSWLVHSTGEDVEVAPLTVYASAGSARARWTDYAARRAARGTPIAEATSVIALPGSAAGSIAGRADRPLPR